MFQKKVVADIVSSPCQEVLLHYRWYRLKFVGTFLFLLIFRPFSMQYQLACRLQIERALSALGLFKSLLRNSLFRNILASHAFLFILLSTLACFVINTFSLNDFFVFSLTHWFLLLSMMLAVTVEGLQKHKKHIIPFLMTSSLSTIASLIFVLSLRLIVIYPEYVRSFFLFTILVGYLVIYTLFALLVSYLLLLKKGKGSLRYVPQGMLVVGLLSLAFCLLYGFRSNSFSGTTTHSLILCMISVTACLLYLQVPSWGILQLWLLKQKEHVFPNAPSLYFESCWLPESYLGTRLHQSIILRDHELERMLWILQFPTQRWAVRKALILLWRESPEKVVELLKRIRADEQWQTALTEHDDVVLGRNIEPTVWEEVLLCELFDVQIDKDILRWYERIMFAPERWLRKSKTLYPACPTELKELALERVQSLMFQREQALQAYLEANPNSASS